MTKRRQPAEPPAQQFSYQKARFLIELVETLEDSGSQDVAAECQRALTAIEQFEGSWKSDWPRYTGFVGADGLNAEILQQASAPAAPVSLPVVEPEPTRQLGDRVALMSRADVMEKLNCGRSKIYTLESQGKLTPIRPTAKEKSHVFYKPAEVDAIINGR